MKNISFFITVMLLMTTFGHQITAQNPASFPVIVVTPDTIVASTTQCNDSVVVPLTITNFGTSPLFFNIVQTADFVDDFENGLEHWALTGYWGLSTSAFEGNGALAESPSGNYANYWDYYVTLKDSLFITNADSATLSYNLKYTMESCCDRLTVQMSINGGSWQNVAVYGSSGSSNGWIYQILDLSDMVENGDMINFRMLFHSDVSVIADGVYIDNFRVSGVGNIIPWLSFSEMSGAVIPGLSNVINLTFHAAGLVNGVYPATLDISTNDPANPLVSVFTEFTLEGLPEFAISANSLDFGDVMQFTSKKDTLWFENNGCDILHIDSLVINSPFFTTISGSYNVPPWHSIAIPITFNPVETIYYEGDLLVFSNAPNLGYGAVAATLSGHGEPAPEINVSPLTISATAACGDSTTVMLTIVNNGNSPLDFHVKTLKDSLVLHYPMNGNANDMSGHGLHGAAYNTTLVADRFGRAGQALSFNGTNAYVDAADGMYFNGDFTVTAWVNISQTKTWARFFDFSNGAPSDNVIVAFSNSSNGRTWFEIYNGTTSGGGLQNPASTPLNQWGLLTVVMKGNMKYIYWNDALKNSGTTSQMPNDVLRTMNYIGRSPWSADQYFSGKMDDFRIYNRAFTTSEIQAMYQLGIADWIEVQLSDGTVASGDSVLVPVSLNAKNLTAGTYSAPLQLASSDPLHPLLTIPVTFTIYGDPSTQTSDTILDFGTVMQFAHKDDTILLSNTGCDTLFFSEISFSESAFTLVNGPNLPYLLPAYSTLAVIRFTPVTTGLIQGTLTLDNNDEALVISLSGNGSGAPLSSLVPDSLETTFTVCNDSLDVPVTLYNSGLGDMDWNATTDRAGTALHFDAYGQWVPFGNLGPLPTEGTIEFWVNTDEWYNYNNCFSTSGLNSGYQNVGFRFEINSSGSFIIVAGNDNNSASSWVIVNPLPKNTWHHIAVYWSKTTNQLKVFYDGNIAINTTNSYWPTQLFNVTLGVGYNDSRYWKGMIDEVRIWQLGRTQAQIQQDRFHSLNGNTPGLLAYWNLNEGSGNQVFDKTAHGFNSTFIGADWVSSGIPVSNFLDVSPTSGFLAAGDSAQLSVHVSGSGMNSGTYNSSVFVQSNDPVNPFLTLPVTVTMIGNPVFSLPFDTLVFDTLMIGALAKDSVLIQNPGCDTLTISQVQHGQASFIVPQTFVNILPLGQQYLKVHFSPLAGGPFNDTLLLTTNAGLYSIILIGQGAAAPSINLEPDTLNITMTECNDTIDVPLTIMNAGMAGLSFSSYQVTEFFDDFEKGLTNWVKDGSWGLTSDAWAGTNAITESPSGNYGNGWNYYITMKEPRNVFNKDSLKISFYMRYNLECSYDYIYLQISVNNGAWASILSQTCSSTSWNFYSFSLSTYANNGDDVKLRFYFHSDGSSTDNGVRIDNFRLKGVTSVAPWLSFNGVSGILEPDSAYVIPLQVVSTNLVSGIYHTTIIIPTNDPLHPSVNVPVNLNFPGKPQIALSDTVIDFGPVMKFTTKSDTLIIFNTGCDTLSVQQLSNTLQAFNYNPGVINILPGNSAPLVIGFHPTITAAVTDTLHIFNNSQDKLIILTGTGTGAPDASYSPDTLMASVTCGDSVDVNFTLQNNGDGTLDYVLSWLPIPTNGIIAGWDFNGNFADNSGNNRNLTNHGATPTTGLENDSLTAYHYMANTYMDYPNTADISTNFFTSNLAVSLWTRLNTDYNTLNSTPYLFSLGGNWNNSNYGVHVYASNGQIFAKINLNYISYTMNAPIIFGSWFHIITQYDGQSCKLYINGELVDQEIVPSSFITYYYSSLGLGRFVYSTSSNNPLTGDLDEIRVYNRGLTPLEIQALYFNAGQFNHAYTASPDTGIILPGDNTEITATLSSTGLAEGIHPGKLAIRSNDPQKPILHLPYWLEVQGLPEITCPDSCIIYDSIMQFTTKTDSVLIQNPGCATLEISQISTSTTSFVANSQLFNIPPFKSRYLRVTFTPQAQGLLTDTLVISSNAGALYVCLSGYCNAIPVAVVEPPQLNKILACDPVGTDTIFLTNGGFAPLIYTVFTPPLTTWLQGSATQDTIGPGLTQGIVITYTRGELPTGLYNSIVQILSNDPVKPALYLQTYLLIPNPLQNVDLGNDTSYCAGNEVVLLAGSYVAYLWNTGDTTATIHVGTPGQYTLQVTDYYGCLSSDTIYVNELTYPIAIAGQDTSMCSGAMLQLQAEAENVLPPAQTTVVLGDGNAYSSSTGPDPFGTYYMDHRTQMLYHRTELHQAGIYGGEINALGILVGSVGSPGMNGFTVKLGTTNANSLTGYSDGLLTVYSSSHFMPATGWNVFPLNAPFYWNGQENLVVEICFDNGSYYSNSSFQYSEKPGMVFADYCDNCISGCNLSGGSVYSQRANLQVHIEAYATRYHWTGPNGFNSMLKDPVIAAMPMAGNGVYVLNVDNGLGCSDSDDKNVTVNQSPVVDAGINQILLGGDTLTLNGVISNGAPPYSTTWEPALTLSAAGILNPQAFPSISTQYTLTASGSDGCIGSDIVDITVIPRYPVSGQVVYNNAFYTALPGVDVILKNSLGAELDTTQTDGSGNYHFPYIQEGNYLIDGKSQQNSGGINATDALNIARHVVALQVLSGIRLQAADVNASNTVTSADALILLHYTVGNITGFPAGKWTFEKKPITIAGSALYNDFYGLCMGDVNGSYIPVLKHSQTLTLATSGSLLCGSEDYIEVPLYPTRNLELGAMTLIFNYQADLLTITGVESDLDGLIYNLTEGEVRIAWQSTTGMTFPPGQPILSFRIKRTAKTTGLLDIPIILSCESELAGVEANSLIGETLLMPKLLVAEQVRGQAFLGQNRPNPFSKNTSIPYFIPEPGKVTLEVFSIIGDKIITFTEATLEQGYHTADLVVENLPDGVYVYRFTFSGNNIQYQASKRMVINR